MATLRKKRKIAVIIKVNREDHPGNNQARNPKSRRIQEDYFNQMSAEIEGRVTKNLSQEFSRAEKAF